MTALDAKYEYEYLIKYKNMSYLHTQWLSGNEIGMFLPMFLPAYYVKCEILVTEWMQYL